MVDDVFFERMRRILWAMALRETDGVNSSSAIFVITPISQLRITSLSLP